MAAINVFEDSDDVLGSLFKLIDAETIAEDERASRLRETDRINEFGMYIVGAVLSRER
jgi:hypothetical protein